jgi:predicted small secreted protein
MIPLRHLIGGLAQIVLLQKIYQRRLETDMDRIIFAIFMLILLGTTAACNTVHGLGRDVERVGEETQDAANAVKRRL